VAIAVIKIIMELDEGDDGNGLPEDVVDIESLMSPEDQARLDVLREASIAMEANSGESARIRHSVRVSLIDLLGRTVGDLLKSKPERHRRRLGRLGDRLLEALKGEGFPKGPMFPRLETVIDAAKEISSILEQGDVEVDAEIFMKMQALLLQHMQSHNPFWKKMASPELYDLLVEIIDYNAVSKTGITGVADVLQRARDIAQAFRSLASRMNRCSHMDLDN
jgi:hypothetical protein